ncbi:monovalent cation/H+ antiporter subunit D family protein [Streptomyces sp. OF3]|uniref:Monovalent cation/H+ antiporter subunit D family protein n=1 Tax=Streptomyces alkaliterrae TaxID=2213162 RepID=A0A5P0YQA5_9ACTN|nr:monovalent cation/H+ antiporter subunit D family protein [Streptomyces alkaliterrae]MBB1259032.1 monovalent cation/H+ antiporter subunit D family protein [Streptomyces alkaliterrae]MQS02455.1 monovalent cation/H+ antiporter subunit D family protein [Streptomyces alkaliterrae]
MSTALTLPVAVPLLAAGLLVLLPDSTGLRRWTAAVVSLGVLAFGVVLLVETADGTVVHQSVGGWPPGIAIVLAADTLTALMLCVSAVLVLASLAFAAGARDDREPLFLPLVLMLSAGVYGAFLTADLFNLFVFVEVMLVPSYALLTVVGGPDRWAAGRVYVTFSLLASTALLGGVGLLYGVMGTVNLGELAGAATRETTAALATGVVLLALAAKAAVVPLHGWLPRCYPATRPSVTLLFSGLLTKVGVYAIIRIYAVVFDGTGLGPVIMAAALVTMVVGVLGAVGQPDMRGILCFHMVSQIGYLLLALALFTERGLAAGVFFLVQYVLVKAALLACAGVVEHTHGTDRLEHLGGLSRSAPLLAGCFLVAAFSLAGMPPLSGFTAKFALLLAAAAQAEYLAVAVAALVSLLTLTSMVKIWGAVFWGTAPDGVPGGDAAGPRTPPDSAPDAPPDEPRRTAARTRARPALLAATVALAVPSLVLGLFAEPLLTAASTAASGLIDPTGYVEAVTR